MIASGAGTDHLAPTPGVTLDEVIAAYEMQCEAVEAAGSRVILMASRALVVAAKGPEDYAKVYGRILAIERRSWKGKSGTGIIDDPMREFYRRMLPRLAAKGQLRVLFVRQAAEDIAFVFGGLTARSYRGLQLSYDEDFKALSPGNLAQIAIIQELCAEGIEAYDLGSELEYKSNWAEERFETVSLVIRPW